MNQLIICPSVLLSCVIKFGLINGHISNHIQGKYNKITYSERIPTDKGCITKPSICDDSPNLLSYLTFSCDFVQRQVH